MNILGIDISLQDIVSVAVGLFGLVTAWLANCQRLPAGARKWLKRIDQARVIGAITRAETIANLTPAQRRDEAVKYLQQICKRELGFPVPASIANLLVEFVYQTWKRGKK